MAAPKTASARRRAPTRRRVKPIWEVIDEIMAKVPEEELRKLPTDGAKNVEHYLYGAPKKP
ncbi:MAG: hypothetical protein FJ290_14605 [Planctomycetes bacterium]|nr:hypothetical protein [Planctomycetota bacterium]